MEDLIRAATRNDAPAFLRLVRELAEFEKLEPPSQEAETRLVDAAFGPTREIEVVLAETPRGEVVAYAILLRTFSSFLARPTLYLEDLYVSPPHRGTGLAERMMRHLAALAEERGCGRLEGIVLGWNERARRFYARTGAREMNDWIFFRYDAEALAALARR